MTTTKLKLVNAKDTATLLNLSLRVIGRDGQTYEIELDHGGGNTASVALFRGEYRSEELEPGKSYTQAEYDIIGPRWVRGERVQTLPLLKRTPAVFNAGDVFEQLADLILNCKLEGEGW